MDGLCGRGGRYDGEARSEVWMGDCGEAGGGCEMEMEMEAGWHGGVGMGLDIDNGVAWFLCSCLAGGL